MLQDYLKEEELNLIFNKEYQSKFDPDLKELYEGHSRMLGDEFNGLFIINKLLEDYSFTAKKVGYIKFLNCKFDNCDFAGSYFWMSTFQNCEVVNCTLNGTALKECDLINTTFSFCESKFRFTIEEGNLSGSAFKNCFFDGFNLGGVDTYGVEFKECSLEEASFQGNCTYRAFLSLLSKDRILKKDAKLLASKEVWGDLIFDYCIITDSNFRNIHFIDTVFKKCCLFSCAFIDSKLYPYNFKSTVKRNISGNNHLDINTLIKSEDIPAETLSKMFNITPTSQAEIKILMKNKILKSVFISYSLKDSKIAGKINEALKSKGVTTFLWEEDALGGKSLKAIMKSNINSKDRLLFIASENSLKSDACQFELTEGRRKQDKLWQTILFPIHIDDFLFTVEKEQIRPKVKQDEYWENIQELRKINSLDFRKVNSLESNKEQDFDKLIEKLIESLKAE